MDAEIITVGNELVLGEINNTNSRYLADCLRNRGIVARWQTTTDDQPKNISRVVTTALNRVDLIFVCGGLGPTADDNTLSATAAALGTHLAIDDSQWQKIGDTFKARQIPLLKNNIRQACYLAGGKPLYNPVGLAVGSWWENDAKTVVVLPGPPREFKAMVDQEVQPKLMQLLPESEVVVDRMLHYFGVPESRLMKEVNATLADDSEVVATSYVQPQEIQVRLTTHAASQQEADRRLTAAQQKVVADSPEGYFGAGQITLVSQVVNLLKQRGQHVTAAESLTGGLVQSMICSVPGASNVFDGGFVTYAPEQKAALLGIQPSIISKYGVVSCETAGAMAEGCRTKLGADFGLGLTGVAGPDSLEGHPAGTVWIGLAENGERIRTQLLHLDPHVGRQAVRLQSAQAILMMLYQRLQK